MIHVNDTLQIMSQFVSLILVLMLFKVGEFTALLAIIAYAIVPMIRYIEHGLRNVPPEIVEASTQVGCTSRQMPFEVRLPLAFPVIMLGLNQTVCTALPCRSLPPSVARKASASRCIWRSVPPIRAPVWPRVSRWP